MISGTLYVLHGFLGSGRNWLSFANRLVEYRPDWRVVLVDLRLHGDSRVREGPHDLHACANDLGMLRESLADDGLTAVLGHSFGGKVALQATRTLDPPPVQTWVIDSTPGRTTVEGSSGRMLRLLEESPAVFADREQAVRWVMQGGFDEPTARWIAMSLRRHEGFWSWDLDVGGLRDLLTSFSESDLWSTVEALNGDAEIRFVRADSDSILSDDDAERIRKAGYRNDRVHLSVLPGGHWLHMDNPDGLRQLLVDDLPVRHDS